MHLSTYLDYLWSMNVGMYLRFLINVSAFSPTITSTGQARESSSKQVWVMLDTQHAYNPPIPSTQSFLTNIHYYCAFKSINPHARAFVHTVHIRTKCGIIKWGLQFKSPQ